MGRICTYIPVDWFFSKISYKKIAAKKVGRIYGIDVKFLEEQDESNNINKFKPEYITASIDTENLKM